VLEDHINLMGANPLRGPGLAGLPRFVDLTRVYDPWLVKLAQNAAKASKLRWHSGVYLAVSGPNYETPAEIRAFRRLGADAVGMSTVPEAIVARHAGIEVLALALVSNAAAGVVGTPISHEEVLEAGRRAAPTLARLIERTAARLATPEPST